MEKHKHIPFCGGHITWSGKEDPTQEQLNIFDKMVSAIMKRPVCKNKGRTIVVLQAAAGVETTAQKCEACGELSEKQIEAP